jgi:hypothetical protein
VCEINSDETFFGFASETPLLIINLIKVISSLRAPAVLGKSRTARALILVAAENVRDLEEKGGA